MVYLVFIMKTQMKELLILHFLNDGIRTTLVVLLPLIALDLSLSLTQVGFLGSSQPLIGALLALPTGFILGKFGGYKVILSLLFVYSLGVLVAAFALNIPLLFVAYFIAALGFGMFHPAGFALTANISADNSVGRNMGNFTAIGEIGRVALPPIAIFASAIIGWRLTFGIVGVVGIILFLFAKFFIPAKDVYNLQIKTEVPENHKQFLKHAFSLFQNKKAKYIALAAIIDSLACSPIYVYLPFLLVAKGNDPMQLSIAMGGFFVGSLIGKSLLGRYADRFGHQKVFMFSEFFNAIALILITLTSDFFLLVFFAVLLGTFTKGTSPVVQTLFSQLADKNHYHKIFAVAELIITIASVTAITLLGIFADRTGITIVFYSGAILSLVAILPVFILSESRYK